MTIETFDDARTAVRDGMPVTDAARELVAALTPDERLWCLDGDAPTWAGLGFLACLDALVHPRDRGLQPFDRGVDVFFDGYHPPEIPR